MFYYILPICTGRKCLESLYTKCKENEKLDKNKRKTKKKRRRNAVSIHWALHFFDPSSSINAWAIVCFCHLIAFLLAWTWKSFKSCIVFMSAQNSPNGIPIIWWSPRTNRCACASSQRHNFTSIVQHYSFKVLHFIINIICSLDRCSTAIRSHKCWLFILSLWSPRLQLFFIQTQLGMLFLHLRHCIFSLFKFQ